MGQGSTLIPRSAMSASTWRVLSGYTTYQRPHEKAFWGKGAPWTRTALVALPSAGLWLPEEEHISNRLK